MRREENQDAFGVLETEQWRLFVVADGMGGVQGGAIAANLAVETFKQSLQGKEQITIDDIRAAVEAANLEIYVKGGSDPTLTGMGTTIVGLLFVGSSLYVVNVGDSRAYILRGGRIGRLTEDHTLVMELLRSGTISVEQAQNHPVSHMLTRSLGPSDKVEVDCRLYPYGPLKNDRYLLCSDGLYNLVAEEEINETLTENSLEVAVQLLVAKANERGGTDNITVIAVEVCDGFPEKIDGLSVEQLAMPGVDGRAMPCGAGTVTAEHTVSEVKTAGSTAEGDLRASAEKSEPVPAAGEARSYARNMGLRDETAGRAEQAFYASRTNAAQRGHDPETAGTSWPKQTISSPKGGGFSSLRNAILGLVAASLAGFTVGVLLYQRGPRPPNLAGLIENVENKESPSAASPQAAGYEVEKLVQPVGDLNSGQAAVSLAGVGEQTLAYGALAGKPDLTSSGSERAGIERRRMVLKERLARVEAQLEAIDNPLSGRIGEVLKEAGVQHKELERRLENLRAEIDVATRKLAVWYGRLRRLETSDPVNLASEVAVSSVSVREKKAAFEAATWEYLSEVEKLKYNPTDKAQARLVSELVKARKQRLEELSREVKNAIERAISESDRHIAELTLQRDQLESKLRAVLGEVEFARIATSGDSSVKEVKRNELLQERELLHVELDELSRLENELSAQAAELESVSGEPTVSPGEVVATSLGGDTP